MMMNINSCIFRHLRWQRFYLMLCVVLTWMTAGLHSYAQDAPIHISSYTKGPYRLSACQSDMGGGGYITGLMQDPIDGNILYSRSDVAGMFKSVDGGHSWRMINSGLDKMSDSYCHSMAMDPFNHRVLLRASGDVRGFQFTGRIHRSVDGGMTWKLVKEDLDYYGNGPTRVYGELIAYNPKVRGEVAAGTYSKGVWISDDGGMAWHYAGLKGERIACVRFCDGKIYVGTIADSYSSSLHTFDSDPKLMLATFQDVPRVPKARIYVSSDHGKTWQVLHESEHGGVFEMVVDDDGKLILYTAAAGVYRSEDGGKTFYAAKDMPVNGHFRALVQSVANREVLYAAEQGDGTNTIPIYCSRDKGKSWKLISPDPKPEDLSDFPAWHGNVPKRIGGRISDILPDYRNPDRLFISNWWGVTVTEDHGKTYTGHNFKGIGVLCMENLCINPQAPEMIVAGVCDHAPAISRNHGETFSALPMSIWPPARLVCLSKWNKNLILFVSENKWETIKLYKSVDGGKTARLVWTLGLRNFIQDIKEDPVKPGRFWAFMEGDDITGHAPGVYRSDDEGETWIPCAASPFVQLRAVPADAFKVERDLTPIVNYQHKNGSGTGQLLGLDTAIPNLIYVGEWTTGLYRSKDGGHSWVNLCKSLPFRPEVNSVLQFVYPHPYRSEVVFAGFWNSGLWRSDDAGDTWRCISPNLQPMNASSMSIHRDQKGKEVMVLACSNHILGDTPTALWLSEDEGQTWVDVFDNSLGGQRFIAVELDAVKQRIYTATAGNGVIYIDYQK